MAAKMYYEDAADIAIIRGKKVAIIGYGSQGHAHALNLKDSGVSVKVGLPATSRSIEKARAAGLEVTTVAEAAKLADVVMILTPDHNVDCGLEAAGRSAVNQACPIPGTT